MSLNPQEILTTKHNCFQQENDLVSILGVKVSNLSMDCAINFIDRCISKDFSVTRIIYIVNAHTLNLAVEDPAFHNTLNDAFKVLGDGTGIRWAAAQRGVRMNANLVGTDLIPRLFEKTAGRGFRYYVLGADKSTIAHAAKNCVKMYPGWELVGYHHGYIDGKDTPTIIEKINSAQPHLLLVGMGNPRQEQWLQDYKSMLHTHIAIGVGGLFDHWGGNLVRAPLWIRRLGFEWLQILLQQPSRKWRRYLIGNPKFLWRITYHMQSDMLR